MANTENTRSSWVERKDHIALIVLLFAVPILAHAGGLGIAAAAAAIAGIGVVGHSPRNLPYLVKTIPTALWAVLALLLWGVVSGYWSPYISDKMPSNQVTIALGVPLFFACAYFMAEQSNKRSQRIRAIFLFCTIGSTCFLLFDFLSGYALSLGVDPVSSDQNLDVRKGDIFQNLSHGLSVLTLMLPTAFVLLWLNGRVGKLWAGVFAGLVVWCAVIAGASADLFAGVAALIAMVFAAKFPRETIIVAFILAIMTLFGAPLLGVVGTSFTETQLAAMPFSWEERIHNWMYVTQKISENPLLGSGFDAVRTFNETHSIRGFGDRAIVSLHPHNAGLHIWVELGLVGILMACFALFSAMKILLRSSSASNARAVAIVGVIVAATVNSSLTYGVWQDWWWAAIIIATATITFIPGLESGKK